MGLHGKFVGLYYKLSVNYDKQETTPMCLILLGMNVKLLCKWFILILEVIEMNMARFVINTYH